MMVFTVDTCIVIALVNRFDLYHKRARRLLEKRTDNLVISFTVMVETTETFLRKFNEVSVKIINIYRKAMNSSNFFQAFEEDFKAMVTHESQRKKNLVNFYDYVYSLIQIHVKNRKLDEIGKTLQNHLFELSTLIPERINSIKPIKDTIYPRVETRADRREIESVISGLEFPKDLDRVHFVVLCVYSKDKNLDYFTTDKRYFLRMTESLNLIRENESFQNIGLAPQYLTESYVENL